MLWLIVNLPKSADSSKNVPQATFTYYAKSPQIKSEDVQENNEPSVLDPHMDFKSFPASSAEDVEDFLEPNPAKTAVKDLDFLKPEVDQGADLADKPKKMAAALQAFVPTVT